MSADVFRTAASLIRERAEAATPGPWIAVRRSDGAAWIDMRGIDDHALALHGFGADAEHIASWHPAVALAVADLLEREVADLDKRAANLRHAFGEAGDDYMPHPDPLLVALARLYLGDTAA